MVNRFKDLISEPKEIWPLNDCVFYVQIQAAKPVYSVSHLSLPNCHYQIVITKNPPVMENYAVKYADINNKYSWRDHLT